MDRRPSPASQRAMPTTPKSEIPSTAEAPSSSVTSAEQRSSAMLLGIFDASVEFLVVGATAAVLCGVSMAITAVDIVPVRTPENAARLVAWLLAHDACLCEGPPHPTADMLLAHQDVRLQTALGRLNVLSIAYEGIMPSMIMVPCDQVELRIATKGRSSPAQGRGVFPVMIVGPMQGWTW